MTGFFILVPLMGVILLVMQGCGDEGAAPPEATETPTETASPTVIALATPAVSVPERPGDFGDYPAVIAQYLTEGGGSPSCLAELFAAWEMPPNDSLPCIAADLDSDGQTEYVVRLTHPEPLPGAPFGLGGDIVIFDQANGVFMATFRLARHAMPRAPEGALLSQPAILGADDYNNDGRLELALTTSDCGAHTCTLALYLIVWREGQYVSIIRLLDSQETGAIVGPVAQNQVRFDDVDGDGVRELLFRQGLIGSVGAGPQRESTVTYRWDGQFYTYFETKFDASELRYFRVRDADDAFAAGDYQRAIQLYQDAIENAALEDVEYLGSREELLAYSQFRIGLAYIKLGEMKEASQAIEAAIGAYPVSLHGKAAVVFRNTAGLSQIGLAGELAAGCQAVTDFAQENLERFREVWYYGYANPEFNPDALCPF